MLTDSAEFMDSLEKWLRAARENDFATARVHAMRMVHSGELLSIHPDLINCFTRSFPEIDPKTALMHFCQLMVCATDGRAVVLKNWVESKRMIDRSNEPLS